MEEKRIKAVPLNGTWESIYQKVKEKKGKHVWIKLQMTTDLLSYVPYREYDGIIEAESKGYLEIEASMDKEGNVSLSRLIQINYGDEDGYGVEPDEYMYGIVGSDGYFIKPLYVK